MRSTLIILPALALIAAVVLWTRRPQRQSTPGELKPLAEMPLSKQLPTSPRLDPVPEAGAVTSAPVVPSPRSNAPQANDTAVFDQTRTDAEYLGKLEKHMNLRWLEASPAKNTPEAKAIQRMLAARGVGREAIPDSYNLAYEYHRTLANAKQAGANEEQARITAGGQTMQTLMTLTDKYKLDPAFFDELLTLKPTVFVGQRNLNAPLGEILLTE